MSPEQQPPPGRSSWNFLSIVVVVVLFAGLGVLLLRPLVQTVGHRPMPPCRRNLQQIGLTLHNFHEDYGAFPPAYVAAENGKPLYSWRVLILPYLNAQELYDRFDLSQSWDSPANLPLLKQMPDVFRCPTDEDSRVTETSYAGIFGPNCVFRGAEPVKFEDITDGMSNTLMVGESAGRRIPWTKPEDIDVSKQATINQESGFRGSHESGAYFMFVDGSLRFIDKHTSQETLMNLFERNDGNPLEEF
jgi:hypothetical protein